ncbi:hypothetical protein LH425_00750 [Laribacter hongkongensis]|uniref:hypothetical protein n=1 Tax=Laribacter hongkongensis TaxID=168471 RepID=UPI001EFEAC90|nr:hypothetical protein [Laribacter hongkongensis]MCG9063577.1 hypothetical protein [Laribacter hongkongensis]
MKNITIFVASLVLSSMACHADSIKQASNNRVGTGITDKKGTSLGINFVPPDEDGWKQTLKGLTVTLNKKEAIPGESREIEAYLMTPDNPDSPISTYIETMKKNTIDAYANNKKFKIVTMDGAEDTKDSRCARMHILLEEVQPTPTIHNNEKKFSEQYALSCRSSKRKNVGFEARYYHRYYESNKDANLQQKANQVLDSIIIVDE